MGICLRRLWLYNSAGILARVRGLPRGARPLAEVSPRVAGDDFLFVRHLARVGPRVVDRLLRPHQKIPHVGPSTLVKDSMKRILRILLWIFSLTLMALACGGRTRSAPDGM